MPLSDCWDDEDKCVQCKESRTPEGHDPCLDTLPGVDYACCGHGQRQGYVAFKNGRCIYFSMRSVGQAHRGEQHEPAKIVIEGEHIVEILTPYYTEIINMESD